MYKHIIKPSVFTRRTASFTSFSEGCWQPPKVVPPPPAIPELIVQVRDHSQACSRKSRNLRREGKIPGALYGFHLNERKTALLFTIGKKLLMDQLRAQGKSFENTVFNLKVEGDDKVYNVIPRQTQFSPLTDLPLNVNFLIRRPDTVFRIPIEFVNEDQNQDLKRGSYVIRVNQFIQCTCDGDIPRNIVVDLGSTSKGAAIKISDLNLPPNVRPAKDVPLDLVICVIKSSRSK